MDFNAHLPVERFTLAPLCRPSRCTPLGCRGEACRRQVGQALERGTSGRRPHTAAKHSVHVGHLRVPPKKGSEVQVRNVCEGGMIRSKQAEKETGC